MKNFTKEDLEHAFNAAKKFKLDSNYRRNDIYNSFEDYWKVVQRERLSEETNDNLDIELNTELN